jgi:hypothetical protein
LLIAGDICGEVSRAPPFLITTFPDELAVVVLPAVFRVEVFVVFFFFRTSFGGSGFATFGLTTFGDAFLGECAAGADSSDGDG